MFSKTNEINAYEGDYRRVWCYSISFHSDLSRIFRSAGFMKNIFCCFLCSLLSNEYINEGKKISLLCVFGAFCVISNNFWSNTTSIRTIWLNAREWELIAICKIWYEFLKICNSWNFLLLKFPKTLQISFRFGRAHSRGGKWWESFQILQSFQVDISMVIDKYDI